MGGLSSRSTLLKKLSFKKDRTYIRLESGNVLFKDKQATMSLSLHASARKIAKSLKRMKYDAIGVGNLDLSAGYHKDEKSPSQRLPFVSLNTVDSKGDNPFLPYNVIQAGSYKVGITSIAAPTKGKMKYTTISWKKALNKQLPLMKEEVDFIVLLSNLTTKENRKIAKDYPGVNVIVSADDKIGNLSPSLIGRTLITQTGTLGQYIGVLDIEIDPNKKWKKNYFKINSLKRKQHSIPRSINKLKNSQSGTENAVRLSELQKELAELPNQIKKAEKELATQQGSSFKVEFVPIEITIDKDPAIEAILR